MSEEFKKLLIARGFNASVAEALYERGVSIEEIEFSTPDELFCHFLEWNGIIGYSTLIRDALDNIRNVEGLSK
jgi:hypothetical protein